ncbi:hypothetical protein WME99_44445 [Sorangium sp. So ce136]|uniref:hypothetical protein n=1 Tax=Sorangium sp. So ce136 TaxID=3133284 RepID=UPI003F1077E1
MRFVKILGSIVLAVGLCGCGRVAHDDTEAPLDDVDLGPSKSRWSFELPSEGTPNDNGAIGPFCCTGVTAVVKSDDGRELGFGYFYDLKGQAYLSGEDSSSAPDFAVRVAGLSDLEADAAPVELETGEIAFTAGELVSGLSRSAQVGALVFTATIEHVEVDEWSVGPMFDMGSLTVRLDVDPVE